MPSRCYQTGLLIIFLFIIFFEKAYAQQPRLVLPIGHSKQIISAVFSPDAKKVITAGDRSVKIWDANTGMLLSDREKYKRTAMYAEFSPDGKSFIAVGDSVARIRESITGVLMHELPGEVSITMAHFSPDGKTVITGYADYTAKIWDAVTGNLLKTLKGQAKSENFFGESGIWAASFSPDGRKIITIADDNAWVWDATSGQVVLRIKESNSRIRDAEFSPDGSRILTAPIKVWDVASGRLLIEIKDKEGPFFGQVTFSPDGKKIAAASGDSTGRIWDATTGDLLCTLSGHNRAVSSLAFSPDGKKIITASDKTAIVWDATKGYILNRLEVNSKRQNNFIISSRFSPDGKKIITVCGDNTARLWDPSTGRLLSELKGHTSGVKRSYYDPAGNRILTVHNPLTDSSARIWNAFNGVMLASLVGESGKSSWAPIAGFSRDGSKVIATLGDDIIRLWDVFSGKRLLEYRHGNASLTSMDIAQEGDKIVATYEDETEDACFVWDARSGKGMKLSDPLSKTGALFESAQFSPDGKKILTISYGPQVKIWDAATLRMLLKLDISQGWENVETASFSPDSKKILTKGEIWDANTGNHLTKLETNVLIPRLCKFSPDGNSVVVIDSYGNISTCDAVTGKKRYVLRHEHTGDITSVSFSADGHKIITCGEDAIAKVRDAVSGKILCELNGHTDIVNYAEFTPDLKRILTASDDNTCKLWDAASGNLIYTFIAIDSLEYLSLIPAGYYFTTQDAAKLLHYVTRDLKVITFEQLDVKYNRPDNVLEAIGNTDTVLIKSYRKAWEKRIKKLGIDTTAFRDGYSVPEADFAKRDSIEYEQKNGNLSLQVKGIDSTYKLDRFNIWVNEAPVFGQRGISIRKRNKNDFDSTITIKLSQGENRIETSITNVNGTESYRMPLTVNYSPAIKQKESIRFIGIGIEQFTDNKYNLQYSVKDIRDLSKKLKEKYGNDILIDTLFNENVTISNVKALKQRLQQTTENDKAIIAYSGHGMLSKEYDYYLSTYSVNFDKPEQNGLPYDELENLLDSIPARKKLMLIDACHSGEVDKEDLVTLNATSDSLIKGLKPVAYKNEGHLGLKNSFELMQSLFVNVGKSTGATIISAAAGTQFALERGDLKNGVFTYSILEAMTKYPTLKISELKKIVGERVEQLTNGLQKPTSRNETIAVDWNVW